MSNLVAFPDPRRVREQASLWLSRLDRGLSTEERAEARLWLTEPANHKAMQEMGRLWSGMDVVSVLAELFPLSRLSLKPPGRDFRSMAIAAAAAVCIVALSTIFLAGLTPWEIFGASSGAQKVAVVNDFYFTAVGESRTLSLGDGSTITLNTNSAIAVIFSARSRDVYLKRGEANFEVAQDNARPFTVHVARRLLQAVGSSFNVRLVSDDNAELTVAEGRVNLKAEGPRNPRGPVGPDARRLAVIAPLETTVPAQHLAIMDSSDVQTVRNVEPAEMDMRLGWQRGMLIFKDEPLEFVLGEVDRYTNTDFMVADEALRNERVGGYFRTGDIDGFLLALRQNFRIESRRDEFNRVILTAAPPL
ncbi:MAG TPA: FecR domain-containing protein [Steroidobacteraceae bacterium]|jgi:transmembrane sensor|nr:FecR domain-containing protein [Steroidobacteraceae bacterium]